MLVALYNRTFDEASQPFLQKLIVLLESHRIRLSVFKDFYERLSSAGISFAETPKFFTRNRDLPRTTNMLFSLGGDGTILDAVCHVGSSGIPIIGINLGRLGFLAAIPESEVEQAVQSLLRGSYTIEQRSLLHLDASVPLFGDTPFALNEFTIHRKDSSSMVKVHTYLNGEFLNTYWADGIIVATPTGSTGYSLSCGGPVVFPQAGSLLITAVAPHNLNVRPIIVPDDNVISFEVEGRADHFLATLDARTETVTSSIQMAVRRESFQISLVRPDEHNFLKTIKQKLYWGADTRN